MDIQPVINNLAEIQSIIISCGMVICFALGGITAGILR